MGKLNKREEITVGYKCNIRCRFCFYGCSPKDDLRSFEEIKKDLLLCKRFGIEQIELSGGEPMLHPDIEKIIGFCRDQGFKTISMITNGTLLTDLERMSCLTKNGLNQFVFSLHGSLEALHNDLTNADTFNKILKSIENATLLKIPFRINVVVTKSNYKDLANIANLALRLKPIMINYLIYSPLEFSVNFADQVAAKYSDIAPEIIKAVDIARQGMETRIRYIPFCLIPGYEKFVCNMHQLHYDPYEWDYILREQIHNGRFYRWGKILLGLFFIPMSRFLTQDLNASFHDAILNTACLVTAAKPRKCRRCRYYFICDGLWKPYISLFGVGELRPMAGKKITDPAALMFNSN